MQNPSVPYLMLFPHLVDNPHLVDTFFSSPKSNKCSGDKFQIISMKTFLTLNFVIKNTIKNKKCLICTKFNKSYKIVDQAKKYKFYMNDFQYINHVC